MIDPNPNLKINPLTGMLNPLPANKSASGLSDSFAQIFSTSLLSGGLGSSELAGSSPASGLFGGGSNGAMNLLLPLMLLLLEQITAQQTEQAAEETRTQETAQSDASQPAPSVNPPAQNGGGDNAEPIGRPVGGVMTQYFHKRHYGLDFGVPVGTPVKSTHAGKVVYSGWNNEGYGNLVIVENGPYRTYYAHLSSLPLQVGDSVSAGQVIGLSGNTGNSTGPHLHYEIRINRAPIDPTGRTLNSGVSW